MLVLVVLIPVLIAALIWDAIDELRGKPKSAPLSSKFLNDLITAFMFVFIFMVFISGWIF